MASRSSRPNETGWYNHVALACYLFYRGFTITETRWNDGVCRWKFLWTDGFNEEVAKFFAEEATVEPLEYFATVTEFKRAMYDANPDYVKEQEAVAASE